jgi:hypothetical protein
MGESRAAATSGLLRRELDSGAVARPSEKWLIYSSIAPLHLEVLQSLILDDGFPVPLLHVNAAAIMCFMEPTKGLGEVMEKANFDANAVKAKLQSIGANTLPSMCQRAGPTSR